MKNESVKQKCIIVYKSKMKLTFDTHYILAHIACCKAEEPNIQTAR